MIAVERADCPLCGGGELRRQTVPTVWVGDEVFGAHRGAFGVTACRGCGFAFVNPRPSDALLDEWYGGEAYAEAGPADARIALVLGFVSEQVRGRRVLDYGCGAGKFLRAAGAAGWQAIGYDQGAAVIEGCRRQGLTVTGELASLAAGSFDAIVLTHVFEHVVDHGVTLEAVRRLLAPGGRVFIEVPNVGSLRARLSHPVLARHARFDERYRAFPVHLSYFTPGTLARMLEKHGFAVERSVTWGFGIDQLRRESEPEAEPEAVHVHVHDYVHVHDGSRGRIKGVVKKVMTRLILDKGLGEAIMVAARP